MGKLVLFRADGTTQDYKLDRERITIGRRADNDVCIPRLAVSGEHAAVVTILEDSFLEDLGSTNGTLVNRTPITKHFLRDRDEIDIGREILVYLADESAHLDDAPRRAERPPTEDVGDAAGSDSARTAGTPHDKRRSDSLAAMSGSAVDAMQRDIAAEIESGATDPSDGPRGTAETGAAKATTDADIETPAVRVLSGTSSGRVVSLGRAETIVGRAGVQVVALRRMAGEIRVVPIEGAVPPSINGTAVPPDGALLNPGDILEVAGSTLALVERSNLRP